MQLRTCKAHWTGQRKVQDDKETGKSISSESSFLNKFIMLILLLEREKNGWSKFNTKKETITETWKGKETKETARAERRKQRKRSATTPTTYCYSSDCVWLSSIRPANKGLRINKPDALCRQYLPSALSTPSAAIANFSSLPLPEEKERQTLNWGVTTSVWKQIIFSSEANERVGKTCTTPPWEMGGFFSPSVIDFIQSRWLS